MKGLALVAIALATSVLASPALADPTVTVTVTAPGTLTLPTTTVYGRPNKPLVSIVIRTPTAAAAAGAAHEQLRQTNLLKAEPAAMSAR